MPLLLVLLLIVFGSAVAAGLPLLVGGLTVLGSFVVAAVADAWSPTCRCSRSTSSRSWGWAWRSTTACSSSAGSARSCGPGSPSPDALARTMATAGRTVLFSAITVAVSLSQPDAVPAGVPALDGLRRGRCHRRRGDHRAHRAARRPGGARAPGRRLARPAARPAAPPPFPARRRVPPLAVRGPVGAVRSHRDAPAGDLRRRLGRDSAHAWAHRSCTCSSAGSTSVPCRPRAEGRLVAETLQADFTCPSTSPIEVLLDGASPTAAHRISPPGSDSCPGVRGVRTVAAQGATTLFAVDYPGEAVDAAARSTVDADPRHCRRRPGRGARRRRHRAERRPAGQPRAATAVDGADRRSATTFVLLFLAFGSFVLPLKAVVMNVLSLGASFGVVTWIFQDGHLSGLLGFTSTGTVETTQPILMLADPVRPVDGLRGVPAQPDPRAVRAERRQHRRRGTGPAAHRADHHQCRAAARGRHRGVLDLGDHRSSS